MELLNYALDIETKDVNVSGEFEGYASTYDVDQGGDQVLPGAFMDSLQRAKKERRSIPMLWQHDQREPIGIWKDFAEDTKGLYVKGQLLIEQDPLARRAHGLLKVKALGGMSIGYIVPTDASEYDAKRRVRKLKKIDLREVSLVTMPMNIEARVTSVKNLIEAGKLPTIREFEDFLRDAGGFSKSFATALASKAAPLLQGEPEAKADNDSMVFLSALLKT